MQNEHSLEGMAAIVTGADSGIGRVIARFLAQAGCRVAINHMGTTDRAEEAVRELTKLGADAFAINADVRRAAEVTAMVDAAAARFGRLDILVNNAAVQTDGAFL